MKTKLHKLIFKIIFMKWKYSCKQAAHFLSLFYICQATNLNQAGFEEMRNVRVDHTYSP